MQRHQKQFGPYTVLAQIGSGGMGTIYRALDTRLEREVALKVLHRDLDVSGARERFVNEARVVSSLNHPNICTIFDIGEQGPDLFLVMEMLHGQSLKERIATGPLPAEEIWEVGRQIARALEAAHARRIVHRDIKPANIFLSRSAYADAEVKVLDFGLAKYNADDRKHRTRGITRHGATVGTIEYMSPEQACGCETDERSDLFSLGAVMYEMATGIAPFRGATSAVIYSELLNNDPLPVRDANLNVPPELDRIIQRLLQKSPENRFQTASELLKDLHDACSPDKPANASLCLSCRSSQRQQAPLRLEDAHSIAGPFSTGTREKNERPVQLSGRRRSVRIALTCLLIGMLAATVRLAWAGRTHTEPFHGTLLIMPFQNRTGDTTLDRVPNEPLVGAFAGARDYAIRVAPDGAFKPNRADKSQSLADVSGVLTGSILPSTNGYAIHVEVTDAHGHIRITEANEFAPSSEQVPVAIGHATAVIRENLQNKLR